MPYPTVTYRAATRAAFTAVQMIASTETALWFGGLRFSCCTQESTRQTYLSRGESALGFWLRYHDRQETVRLDRRKKQNGPHFVTVNSFPTPIGHEVVPGVRQLVLIGAVGQH